MKKIYERPTLARQSILSRLAAGNGASLEFSDRRVKTNISRVGTTVFGLPLYRFSYLGSDTRFTGVMAQDVIGVMPKAVSRDASGFYSVNYGMLGIEMTRG